MAARDLCTIDDVVGYVPGYDPLDAENAATQAKLVALISAQSRSIHQQAGREFKAIDPEVDPRLFQFRPVDACNRLIRIGDCAEVTQLRLLDQDGSTELLASFAANQYALLPRVREEWQPVTEVKLLAAGPAPAAGQLLEVSGSWGFPSVPVDVVEACAKLVIVRYLSDVAAAGTPFADAIADSEISVGALLVSAREAISAYASPEVG